jgi:hypothetical protein
MESAHSIRFLYRHFLSGITEKSLNAFYYACTHAKVDYSRFMNVTAAMALKLVPERLKSQPVFLCIDDTMVAKFGKKVEDVSRPGAAECSLFPCCVTISGGTSRSVTMSRKRSGHYAATWFAAVKG